MPRNSGLVGIAVVLCLYGIYAASFVPALLAGRPVPLLLAGYLLQACAALLAAAGVWTGRRWAPGAIVLLGIAIAVTEIVEAFVVGIIAYDRALVVAVLALIVTFIAAGYVRRPGQLAA